MQFVQICFSFAFLISSAYADLPNYREALRQFNRAHKISSLSEFENLNGQTYECSRIYKGQTAGDSYLRFVSRGSKVFDQVSGESFGFKEGDLRQDGFSGGDPSCKRTRIARVRSNGDVLVEETHCKTWRIINHYLYCPKVDQLKEHARDRSLGMLSGKASAVVSDGANTFVSSYGADQMTSILKMDRDGREVARLDSPTFSKLLNGEIPKIFFSPKLAVGNNSGEIYVLGYDPLKDKNYTLVAVSTDFKSARIILRDVKTSTLMHVDTQGQIILIQRAGWKDPKPGTGLKVVSRTGQVLEEQFYENIHGTVSEGGARLANGKTVILADCYHETQDAIGCKPSTRSGANRGLVVFDQNQKKERFIRIDHVKYPSYMQIQSVSPNSDGTFWVSLNSLTHNGLITLLKMDDSGTVLNEIGVGATKNRSTLIPHYDYRFHSPLEVNGRMHFVSPIVELVEIQI